MLDDDCDGECDEAVGRWVHNADTGDNLYTHSVGERAAPARGMRRFWTTTHSARPAAHSSWYF